MEAITIEGRGSRARAGGAATVRPAAEALEQRLVPTVDGMETLMHLHAHLSIFVDGQQIAVPANIGISPSGTRPVHTHDDTGRIHIESNVIRDFHLSDLFASWGQPFTKDQLLSYRVGPDRVLTMTVNGTPTDALGDWTFHDHDDIVLRIVSRPADAHPAVAALIAHSAEHYNVLVREYYGAYLGRSPDAAGLVYWSGRLQQGLASQRVEAMLLDSPEYVARHGGGGSGWVGAVYHDLLGRAADAGALAYWGGRLSGGAAAEDVAAAVAGSAERWGGVVRHLYAEHLDRAPSAADVDAWVAQASHGLRFEDMEAALVDSAEYHGSPAKGQGDPWLWVRSAYEGLLHRSAGVAEADYWAAQVDPAAFVRS